MNVNALISGEAAVEKGSFDVELAQTEIAFDIGGHLDPSVVGGQSLPVAGTNATLMEFDPPILGRQTPGQALMGSMPGHGAGWNAVPRMRTRTRTASR